MRSLIDKALQAVLKMLKKKDERVLLWQNASPTSAFTAQTMDLDLTGYDAVEVYVNRNVGSAKTMQNFAKKFRIPVNTYILFIEPPGIASTEFYSRQITVADTKRSIAFSAGNRRLLNLGSSASNTNEVVIPTAIYGIKFGGAS